MKYLAVVLAIAIGVAAVVYGEGDDSPGLQLLGAVLVVAAIVFGVRTVRRSR
jgi:predicted cobalt transporter CbtA